MDTSTKPGVRSRISRSPEEWCDIIARFEQSGQTRQQFCAEQNLGLSTFSRWRHRLGGEQAKSTARSGEGLFVELSPDTPAPSAPSWVAELQVGADVVLRVRQSGC